MRILIFGATGLLGKALMRSWPTGLDVIGLGSKDADIRVPQQVEEVIRQHSPDWIVLAAAYTDVDGCETNTQLAWDVNCTGALNVVGGARNAGARVLFLSTDYVFDGSKTTPYETTDPRAPRAVYGKTKAEAEERILQVMPECCVVRTSWVFGTGGKCFPDTILKLASSRNELTVVDDQRGCPTYTNDLATAIYELISCRAEGVVHATNRGECTWFEFAGRIVQEAGLATKIVPTTSGQFVRPAKRPKYSVLSPASLEKLGISMPGWENALRRYVAERADAANRDSNRPIS
jgi:dTDP-4-dehydrorhamnose reductase